MLDKNTVHLGDCFNLLPQLEDSCVDLLFADLPYGIIAADWDVKLDLTALWKELHRVCKPNAAMIFTGKGKFTAELIMSNLKEYRYSLVWKKSRPVGFLNSKKMPLSIHEDIVLFYKKQCTYNPQKTITDIKPKKPRPKKRPISSQGNCYRSIGDSVRIEDGTRFPTSVITIPNPISHKHPTTKPVSLLEWLLKTYSNEGDLVLDPVAGSGSTAIAAINTNRNYICFEKQPEYYNNILQYINKAR